MIVPIVWYGLKTLDLLITQRGLSTGYVETNPLFSVYAARWFNVITTFLIFFLVICIKKHKLTILERLIKLVLIIMAIDILHNIILLVLN